MAKLTLTPINSGYTSDVAINNNSNSIEVALENTLSRDGTTPNNMIANFDMNGYRIINLATPQSSQDAARLVDIQAASTGMPSQTGNADKFLKTDGTVATWKTKSEPFHIYDSVSLGTTNVRHITEDNTYLYIVANQNPGKVIRVRKSDLSVQGTLSLTETGTHESGALGCAIDIANNRLYVTLGTNPASVTRINTITFTQIDSLVLSGVSAAGIAIDTSGQLLYVGTIYTNTTNGPDYLMRINLTSWTITGTILGNAAGVGGAVVNERGYYNLTLDLANNRLYVGQDNSGTGFQITVINLTTFTRISSLSAGTSNGNGGFVIDTTNGYLYNVSGQISDTTEINRINLSTFTVTATYNFPATYKTIGAGGLSLDVSNQRLYLFGAYSDWASCIKLPSLEVLHFMPTTNLRTISAANYCGAFSSMDGFIYVLQYDYGILYKWSK